jgi:thioredoxin-like negative regulator of GroEL
MRRSFYSHAFPPVLASLLLLAGVRLARPTWADECPHLETIGSEELAAARKAGRGIVLAFGAEWCPICSRQGVLLSRLANERADCGILLVHLDLDANRELARSLGVREQGTLLGLRGEQEIARLVGVSDMASIRALLDKVRDRATQ